MVCTQNNDGVFMKCIYVLLELVVKKLPGLYTPRQQYESKKKQIIYSLLLYMFRCSQNLRFTEEVHLKSGDSIKVEVPYLYC